MRTSLILSAFVAMMLAFSPSESQAAEFQTGFADGVYQSPDQSTRDLWLDRTVDAKAGIVRVFVEWRGLVSGRPADPRDPADPAYDFTAIDGAVRDSLARRLDPLLTTFVAPSWAEGQNRPSDAALGSWKPSPSALGDFAFALATRYSGGFPDPANPGQNLPRVRYFQSWNEPNLDIYLGPQWDGGKNAAATHYRQMLNRFDAAIKAVHLDNRHVSAGLAPYGEEKGGARTRPLVFWRELFCLNSRLKRTCSAKSHFDIFGIHAINTSGSPRTSALDPDDMSTADLGESRKILAAAERAGTALGKRHQTWVTEFWWESNPPDKAEGYPLQKQARFIEETMYLAWKAGATAAIGLQILDAPYSHATRHSVTADGIYFNDGSAKPSARAFRFPFVARRATGKTVNLWVKPPSTGKVTVERKAHGKWRRVGSLSTGGDAIATGNVQLSGRVKLRAKVSGETSLPWSVGS